MSVHVKITDYVIFQNLNLQMVEGLLNKSDKNNLFISHLISINKI